MTSCTSTTSSGPSIRASSSPRPVCSSRRTPSESRDDTDSASPGTRWGSRFEGNLVQRVHRSGVDFEFNPGRTASQVEIVGNTFRAFRLNWIAAGAGARDGHLRRVQSDRRGLDAPSKMGPRDQDPPSVHERWTFEGNVSDSEHRGHRSVFILHHVRGFTFIGNVQPMPREGPGESSKLFGHLRDHADRQHVHGLSAALRSIRTASLLTRGLPGQLFDERSCSFGILEDRRTAHPPAS